MNGDSATHPDPSTQSAQLNNMGTRNDRKLYRDSRQNKSRFVELGIGTMSSVIMLSEKRVILSRFLKWVVVQVSKRFIATNIVVTNITIS